jgi:methionine-R-sulfoxide reductase
MQYEDRSNTADRAEGDSSPAEILQWDDVVRLARQGNPLPSRRVEKTEAQWRALLTDEQFRVTRLKGTERAHTSDMCRLFEPGQYRCLCCDTVLFDAARKYQSHSGWPSFTQPVTPGVIAYHQDDSYDMNRIETACNVPQRV